MDSPLVERKEGFFQNAEGIKLYEQSWRPLFPARGILIIVHGIKDHSQRYTLVAEPLVRKGFAVYSFDLRGHGRSEGKRVWVDRFDQYLDDLQLFLKRVQDAEPGKPVFIFGHSMGGAIVTLFAMIRKPEIQGILLSAPALRQARDVSGFQVRVTKLLGSIAPSAGVFKPANSSYSRDPQVVADMDKDPLIYQKPHPARLVAELLKAMDRIRQGSNTMTIPVLLMHGTADLLANPDGSREFHSKVMSKDKTLKIYEGLYHDITHEPERDIVMNDMSDWLNSRT